MHARHPTSHQTPTTAAGGGQTATLTVYFHPTVEAQQEGKLPTSLQKRINEANSCSDEYIDADEIKDSANGSGSLAMSSSTPPTTHDDLKRTKL